MPKKKIPAGIPQGSKWCHGCQQARPLQMFWADRSKKDGRHYCCTPCAELKLKQRADRSRMFNELFLRFSGEG